ncbi:MAG TPA: S-layer homology domain-containing protein [Blastocatellia bacterium]|nr:S-layer homology domain-containing protein [Blastocatellia bacterium]
MRGSHKYVLTARIVADQLKAEGWQIEILAVRGPGEDAKWQSVAPQGECTFSITPSDAAFADVGGSGSFSLMTEPDCEWVAIISDTWINVYGVPQGTGPAMINFIVGQNNSPDRRTGFIFIGGQFFNIFQGAQFADVPQSHPFYVEIGKISGRGITLGCTPGNFCPDDVVTRQQVSAFILRTLGEFDPPTPAMQRFADVPPSNFFYDFIDRMAELGITLGCDANNFCPEAVTPREQMATFIIRALGEFDPPTPAVQRFVDVPPTNPFYNFIDRLAELGITQGCTPTMFCPSDSVSRGQMAALLVRAFNL